MTMSELNSSEKRTGDGPIEREQGLQPAPLEPLQPHSRKWPLTSSHP